MAEPTLFGLTAESSSIERAKIIDKLSQHDDFLREQHRPNSELSAFLFQD
jgi:hypothetical protein